MPRAPETDAGSHETCFPFGLFITGLSSYLLVCEYLFLYLCTEYSFIKCQKQDLYCSPGGPHLIII